MNARVLELIKNPEQISADDLKLLESEILNFPYVQNIRALHLFGTHRFQPENYQKELSKTAAYTTDKKILYNFINQKTEETSVTPEPLSVVISNKFVVDEIIEIKQPEPSKPVFINGERNRILFEGEEDFLERDIEKIDIEATLESGVLVTESMTPKVLDEVNENKISEIDEVENHEIIYEKDEVAKLQNAELILEENQTPEVEEIQQTEILEHLDSGTKNLEENTAELSFHGIDSFLPTIEVPVERKKENYQPKPQTNRHEEEMKRLIAEVEAKIKAKKKTQPVSELKIKEEETVDNHDISFAETQNFEIKSDDVQEIKMDVEPDIKVAEAKPEIAEAPSEKPAESKLIEEVIPEKAVETSWKPMSFSTNKPDALISKEDAKPEIPKTENAETKPVEKAEEKEERPVFNVSFFAENVEKIETETKEETTQKPQVESNVPRFINTWQNWLKIDRTSTAKPEIPEKVEEKKVEIKEKAIEKFIENEPKISKLKEETSFVVKEKADDISHLMTETLAKLYTEQKLYSKAIKAYEILQKKYPEKQDYFVEKIEEIKFLRQNK